MIQTERKPAPAFSAMSSTGKVISLADYRGKHLVLYFYPRSFTLGCTKETIAFRDAAGEIRALGGDILGVSRDPQDVQCRFADHYQSSFPLLADEGGDVTRAYGVMFPILPLVKRVTFVIDPESFIVARFHHELKFEKHASDALQFLRERTKPQ